MTEQEAREQVRHDPKLRARVEAEVRSGQPEKATDQIMTMMAEFFVQGVQLGRGHRFTAG